MQISIFDGEHKFKIDKPIRLIELFSGYGSQALALKYLDIPFEHYRIAEWAVKSIQAYKDMHFTEDTTDYSKDFSLTEIIDFLYCKGISANYNEPMTYEQIKRLGESKSRTIFNNIKATNNLVSVCNTNGEDLGIIDTHKYDYILTYSFPCQDLSNAGKKLGMDKDSGTRSGLLWEVERLLTECKELPQVLIMENVPEVIGTKNIKNFAKWIERLDKFGYKSKWQVINGIDFGIPQNRKRCFMVSVLGNYYYHFPNVIGCKLKLKDLLETEISQEYYLSDSILDYFVKHTEECKENGNGFRFEPTNGDCIAKYITTRAGSRMDDNFIKSCDCVGMLSGEKWEKCIDSSRRVYSIEKASPTITTCGGGHLEPKIFNKGEIRKLTEKECFRLMGVKDEDFEKVAKNQAKSSLYHLAGDSIIVNVLIAIFKEML